MPANTFEALGIAAPLVTALTRLDITTPTAVQMQAIPPLLEGRDLITCAPTGTGKTAAFMVPALQRITSTESRRGRGPRILVLTPTRELAQQVNKATQGFARTLPRLTTVCVTGGAAYQAQNKQLAAPHEVMVATPGRLMDQMRTGRVSLSRVDILVLDEADRMLDMGFADDVTEIARNLPADRQTVCFTATLSRGVRDLASALLRNPQWLTVERSLKHDSEIDDHVIFVDDLEHRNRVLDACLADEGLAQAIVFTATKRHAEELAIDLFRKGVSCQALHGDLTQRDRTKALNKLRRGECKVLVATDVAARGIDVATISHVINFDLPKFPEDYVHRIGRTGRAGAAGQAISFVGAAEVYALRRIEQLLGRRMQVSEIGGLEARFRPSERAGRGKPGPRGPRNPGRTTTAPRAGKAGVRAGGPDARSAGAARPVPRDAKAPASPSRARASSPVRAGARADAPATKSGRTGGRGAAPGDKAGRPGGRPAGPGARTGRSGARAAPAEGARRRGADSPTRAPAARKGPRKGGPGGAPRSTRRG